HAVGRGGVFAALRTPGSAAPLLVLTLLGAVALAWRFRWRGLVAGLAAYLVVAGAWRDGPWIDPRLATEDVVERWEPGRLSGPMGPPDLRALAVPFELPRGPWILGPGEQRNSRRTGLPPGAYRVELRAAAVEAPFRMAVDVASGQIVLGSVVLTEAQPEAAFSLLLPTWARQAGLTAMGEAGRAR